MENPIDRCEATIEIETIINPFYVFSGTIDPHKFINIQVQLLDRLGPEEYFHTQLNVIHSSVSQMLREIRPANSDDIEPNVNLMGNA
jgi:hypothetical protein